MRVKRCHKCKGRRYFYKEICNYCGTPRDKNKLTPFDRKRRIENCIWWGALILIAIAYFITLIVKYYEGRLG